eukprot:10810963-Alexandrium_andersonii.AAC.1
MGSSRADWCGRPAGAERDARAQPRQATTPVCPTGCPRPLQALIGPDRPCGTFMKPFQARAES